MCTGVVGESGKNGTEVCVGQQAMWELRGGDKYVLVYWERTVRIEKNFLWVNR
jgi:hypothetical protein